MPKKCCNNDYVHHVYQAPPATSTVTMRAHTIRTAYVSPEVGDVGFVGRSEVTEVALGMVRQTRTLNCLKKTRKLCCAQGVGIGHANLEDVVARQPSGSSRSSSGLADHDGRFDAAS
jgi:hypothetical protein